MTDMPMGKHPDIPGLIAGLQTITPLVPATVLVPGTGMAFAVMVPESIDALLDSAADDPEDNLPYWAEVWPSGVALAAEILRNPAAVHGLPVLELGCGAGITAAAAMMAGAHLVATDYSPHSLNLTALTCLQADHPLPDLRQVNWRAADADLFQQNGEPWPLVLAGDVLYEDRDIEPVLAVFNRIVAPAGEVWLAEPGRRVARAAVDLARSRGWDVQSRTLAGPWPGTNHVDSDVTVHRMTRPR